MSGEAPAAPPPLRRPPRQPYGAENIEGFRRRRPAIKWAAGVLLALDMLALLFALSFANATAEGPAHRGLEHSVAILTDVDSYLDENYDSLQVQATLSRDDTIVLPDFPIPVSIGREDLLRNDREQFRAIILARSADAIHDGGVAVMEGDREAEISFFSTPGAVRTGMDILRPTPHRVLSYVTTVLAVIAAFLAAVLLLAARGYGRVAALGLTVLAAAGPFLILAIAARFALRVATSGADDVMSKEFLELGQEFLWAPIRNGIIFAAGSGILALAGLLLAGRDARRPRQA